jgi:hypothetical protein
MMILVIILKFLPFVDVEEFLIQDPSERVERNVVFRDVGLGKRFMKGRQKGIWRNTWAIKRIMFVDDRDLMLFNHGSKKEMNVEDRFHEKCE